MRGTKRIGHLYASSQSESEAEGWDSIPRGWISPEGKFFRTKFHWASIAERLGSKRQDDPETGEKFAHRAYSLGWISLGHGGVLNAIGHESALKSSRLPAILTLRKLVSKLPHLSLRVEKQIGKIDPETGRHEDFDVKEYDLDFFIKHGKMKKL